MGVAARTGLIVEVPFAEPLVADFRQRMDPHAALGVPAHITVLYPFIPVDQLTDEVIGELCALFALQAQFDFAFERSDWFGRDVLWLAPTPDAPFQRLTDALVRNYPEYPPYGGQFEVVQPHLTVADHAPPADMRRAQHELDSKLPLHGRAASVTLMVEQESRRWNRLRRFPLGPA